MAISQDTTASDELGENTFIIGTTQSASTQIGSGSDTLVLKITQDAYQGDAQYAVYVDGKQIGGKFTATALHGSGQTDTLEIKGDWAVGNHDVSVKLLNDLYHGSPTTDRNIYVENATYNGAGGANSNMYVNSTSAKSFPVTDETAVPTTSAEPTPTNPAPSAGTVTQISTGPDTLVLRITQDAYQGDAEYAVYVDGRQVGGTFTAKALRGSGQSDIVEIKGDWTGGNHSISVKLLNDLYHGSSTTDRNVYVEDATYNGATVSGSNLYVNSTTAKGFTVTDLAFTEAPGSPTTPDSAPAVRLTKATTQIKSTRDGQVIENLDIWVDNGHGIQVTHDNVIIRNVRIHHKEGNGINLTGASGVRIENVEVINNSPPSGINPETSSKLSNIETLNAPNLTIRNVTVREGSTGIYLVDSPNANLEHVEGYNFHGPFPRGQFVQFNRSGNSSLKDFYAFNDPGKSHVEDIVSVYSSANVKISNGVIDGNNSRTGVGIMFEAGSTGGRVTNVDAIHQGNGAFSSYVSNVVFDDTRTFDSIHADQGRGWSASNGLHWNVSSGGVSILNSTYTDPGNPKNIVWDRSKAGTLNVIEDASATPMLQITNDFDWVDWVV